jgi:tetratricopeptide (TPR) repeat protein
MKSRYRIFIYIILLMISFVCIQGADAEEEKSPEYIFLKANTLYADGRYDEAANAYEQLLDRGIENGSLYFNLGNSYFKKGELGEAVLHYERAQRLIPRDSDLKSNYAFARSKITYSAPGNPSWLMGAVGKFNMLTVNEMTIVVSFIFTCIFLILIMSLFIRKIRRHLPLALSLSIVVFVLFTGLLFHRVSALDKEAVILSERVDAKFEPLDNATIHFTLYEGMKVDMVDLKKEWTKVRRQDGKTGWIRNGEMGKI